jgi:LAGLIDADG DNA endonuclease family
MCPTGIKIFSWLPISFSKKFMASSPLINLLFIRRPKKGRLNSSSIRSKSSRSNRKYLNPNTDCTALVPYGSNLSSTVNSPKYTLIVRQMVEIPIQHYSIFIGILISDAWLQHPHSKANARLGFKQSLSHFEFFWHVFTILSHYCSAYPYITKTTLNRVTHYSLGFTTRSLPCITELWGLFYFNGKKIVPKNLFDILTPEALAYWIARNSRFTYCNNYSSSNYNSSNNNYSSLLIIPQAYLPDNISQWSLLVYPKLSDLLLEIILFEMIILFLIKGYNCLSQLWIYIIMSI